jgi:actin-related protein 10
MSSSAYETPRKRAPEPVTPQITRIGTTVQSSPHYTTTRRHSLYGTEDRIVLDPGSRIWKMGFSGEGRPRELFFAARPDATSLWSLSRPLGKAEREEEDRTLKNSIQDLLRRVFHECVDVHSLRHSISYTSSDLFSQTQSRAK